MEAHAKRPAHAWWTYGTPVLLGALVCGAVAFFLLVQAPRERADFISRLSTSLGARADIRALAIDRWLEDGLDDAATVASYPSVHALMSATRLRNAGTSVHLDSILTTFARIQRYDASFVVDGHLELVAAGGAHRGLDPVDRDLARRVLASGRGEATIHIHAGGMPEVSFCEPVREGTGPARGIVIDETSPMAWLYPLLALTQPDYRSAEALIARRDGEWVEFLSPLRFSRAAPLTTRVRSHPRLAATLALSGRNLFGLFRDYRGAPVFADVRRLRSAPWGLVVKVDEREVLAGLRRRLLAEGLAWALVVIGFSIAALTVWRGQLRAQEVELLRSRTRLALLLDQAHDGILFFRDDGTIVEANRRADEMYGFTRGGLVGRHVDELRAPEPSHPERAGGGLLAQEGTIVETTHRRRDGTTFPVEASVRRADMNGESLRLSIVRDVTARQRGEEELRTFLRLVEQSPVSVVVTDPKGDIQYVNPKFCEVSGYSRPEVLGRNPRIIQSGLTPGTVYAELWRTLGAGGTWRGELCNRRKSGELFWEDVSIGVVHDAEGRVIHLLAVKEDITEKKRTEEALSKSREEFLQAQKMEAIGRLAGGVAHDFNNLLSVIHGYAEMLLMRLAPGDGVREMPESILRAADRAASLTRQLLAFSRRQVLDAKVVDLGALLTDMGHMLERLIGEDIQLEVRRPQELGRVRIDPWQLEQAVLNLAVNARDAMPDGGRLLLELSDVTFAAADAPETPDGVIPAGAYVLLDVSDTGPGMTPEIAARIFEPFFTTKEVGKGTGLGLSTVYGIVKQSGGYVWVTTEPGQGTTFHVCLPRVDEPIEAQSEKKGTGARGHGEVVLLVEDDPGVRTLAREILERRGYRVLPAANGSEALALACDHPDRIDLLLTDVILPGMNGRQVADHVINRRPGIHVLFMSGYTHDVVARQGVLEPGLRLLQKPFTVESLASAVTAALLDGRPAS